ncbi:MAG: VCBS repeat-containing protein [Flavobacteriales bacterium]|nr:VCBS repeat-containing protein [Flavobacteriales bacterium]
MTNFLLISPRSLISVVVWVPLFLHAQTYTDLALDLGISHSNDASAYWGAGVSFADFNDDGLDDISICQKGQPPLFFQNNGNGFDPISNWVIIASEVKSLSWVDFDNDGDKDLFLTCYNAPYHLYRRDGEALVDISTEAGLISTSNQTFGHSWGDYNGDGFLDVYINNYNYFDGVANQFYENNGDGTFTEKGAELGIDNGPNFSFQSLWIDFDEDGDQDLFIINDNDSPQALTKISQNVDRLRS